ncbi:MAG: alpha-amylase family glycosyl hydrolase [Myxococcales bacterium]|nr:alpha-amylase family glycosyl hydrolase [Myxococcales bacterium]
MRTLLLLSLCSTACLTPPPDAAPVPLTTHVEDWRDEVIYQVLVDRFANGDVNNDFGVQAGHLSRFQGGDWRGLQNHLDYFERLGVTTLWISPVVRNVDTDADFDAYHGYWAQDLMEPNPHFGDLADLRSLVNAAHRKNLKVVLDIVTNHMGQVFFYDQNMNGKPDVYIGGSGSSSPVSRSTEFDPDWDPRGVQVATSLGVAGRAPIIFFDLPDIYRQRPKPEVLGTADAYHGFGRTLDYEAPAQLLMGDFPGGLKDVATELPEVREAMVDAYARWAELADLDGFRIDTVKHVEHGFWQHFAPAVRERLSAKGKNRFLMFGEAFDGRDELLGSFTQPGELDSVFNFSQKYVVYADIFEKAHDANAQRGTSQIEWLWNQRKTNWSNTPQPNGIGLAPSRVPVNFIDNHDTARFLFNARGDVKALRNALTLLLTEEGIPCVYYGTELDFFGGNDPANREVMWTTGFDSTGATWQHVARLNLVRKQHAALRRGDTKILFSTTHTQTEPDAGLFAFERSGGEAGDDFALVVLNTNARQTSRVQLTTSRPAGSMLVDAMTPGVTLTVKAGGLLDVEVPAQGALVLVKP